MFDTTLSRHVCGKCIAGAYYQPSVQVGCYNNFCHLFVFLKGIEIAETSDQTAVIDFTTYSICANFPIDVRLLRATKAHTVSTYSYLMAKCSCITSIYFNDGLWYHSTVIWCALLRSVLLLSTIPPKRNSSPMEYRCGSDRA